jgi:hypothetical protein
MAQQDLENLFKHQTTMAESEVIFKKIEDVIPDTVSLKLPYVFHSIISKIREERESQKKKEQELIKYSLCEHTEGPQEYTGHDSHKDYYQTRCTKCRKILQEWSI